MVYLGFPIISGIPFPYSHIYIRLAEITNMNSTWCKCATKNINDKYEKEKKKNFWDTKPWSQSIGNGPLFLSSTTNS